MEIEAREKLSGHKNGEGHLLSRPGSSWKLEGHSLQVELPKY
jgi:hypothetical protein